MNTTTEYLDAVKAATGAASDYALAPIIGVSKQQISRYRHGEQFLSGETAVKVAEILGIDAGIVAAAGQAERSKNDTERQLWRSVFEKLGGVAAGVVIGLAGVSPSPADAGEGGKSVYYVK